MLHHLVYCSICYIFYLKCADNFSVKVQCIYQISHSLLSANTIRLTMAVLLFHKVLSNEHKSVEKYHIIHGENR